VSGLGIEITVAEYRAGNKKDNAPDKINTRYKVPDVTLKRGSLVRWISMNGSRKCRTVIKRQGEWLRLRSLAKTANRSAEMKLANARPSNIQAILSGKGTDVAIEELVLACERIDLDRYGHQAPGIYFRMNTSSERVLLAWISQLSWFCLIRTAEYSCGC